jgi:hypothetical protein
MADVGLRGLGEGIVTGIQAFQRQQQFGLDRRNAANTLQLQHQRLLTQRQRVALEQQRVNIAKQRIEQQKKTEARRAEFEKRAGAIKRLDRFTQPFDENKRPNPLFSLKKSNPDVWKALVKTAVEKGFDLDPTNKEHKALLDIMTKAYQAEGPISKKMNRFMDQFNRTDERKKKLILETVIRDPSKIPEAMEALEDDENTKNAQAMIQRENEQRVQFRQRQSDMLRQWGASKDTLAKFDPQAAATLEKTVAETQRGQDKVFSVFEIEKDGTQTFIRSITADQRRPVLEQAVKDKKRIQIFDSQSLATSGQALSPVTRTQAGKLRAGRVKALGTINTALRLKGTLTRLGPGAIGLRGKLGETLGGIAGQISKGLGQLVTRKITGTSDAGEITAFRLDSQRALGQLMPTFTGEPSRFTQIENELVRARTRLLAGGASFSQIQGALDSIILGAFLSHDRNAVEAGGEPTYDLIDDKGQNIDANVASAYVEIKRSTRLSRKEVLKILVEMARQQTLFRNHGLTN